MRLLRAAWRVVWNFAIGLFYTDDDLCHCEACGHDHLWEHTHYSESCNFCSRCWEDIQNEINSCEHLEAELRLTTDEMGDPCISCSKCSGLFLLTEPKFETDRTALAELSLKDRLAFEDWMRRLDAEAAAADAPYGKGSLWELTGVHCWLDFFRDPAYRDDPKGALFEDLSNV